MSNLVCGAQLVVSSAYSPWASFQCCLCLVLHEHSTCPGEADAVVKDLHGQQHAQASDY